MAQVVKPTNPLMGSRVMPLGYPIYLGTSSWSFPGWEMVFGESYRESVLAKSGLEAYAKHSLLTAVGLDRSFYAPLTPAQYAVYAAVVPENFRFLVKAPDLITGAQRRDDKGRPIEMNPHHLDSVLAIDQYIEPALEGLGNKLGCLVFQFSPLPRHWLQNSAEWIDCLGEFLVKLPRLPAGTSYAIEIRDQALLTPRLMKTLAASGATYCLGLHDRLAPLPRQLAAWDLWKSSLENSSIRDNAPLIVRWTLRQGMTYQSAKKEFSPFTKIHYADDDSMRLLAERIRNQAALGAVSLVIINNKAEGCAPLSVARLDAEIEALLNAQA